MVSKGKLKVQMGAKECKGIEHITERQSNGDLLVIIRLQFIACLKFTNTLFSPIGKGVWEINAECGYPKLWRIEIMTNKICITDLQKFDMAEHLPDEKAIAEYLTIVLEENDPAALAQALGTVARARGMTEIAAKSGLAREALYKALRPDSQPRFETITRVCQALGVKLVAQPIHAAI